MEVNIFAEQRAQAQNKKAEETDWGGRGTAAGKSREGGGRAGGAAARAQEALKPGGFPLPGQAERWGLGGFKIVRLAGAGRGPPALRREELGRARGAQGGGTDFQHTGEVGRVIPSEPDSLGRVPSLEPENPVQRLRGRALPGTRSGTPARTGEAGGVAMLGAEVPLPRAGGCW